MKAYSFLCIFIFHLLVFTPLWAQDMAYPIQGDGVLSFLRRWERVGDSYVQEFIKMNADKLNAKGGLEMGTVYLIPPLHPGDEYQMSDDSLSEEVVSAENILEDIDSVESLSGTSIPEGTLSKWIASGGTNPSIFGKKMSVVKPQSTRLKNACFYIISGHGGPDPGAIAKVGNRTLHEDEYAYDIALRLAHNLMMDGATVYVIIQDPKDGIRDEMYLNNSSNETCMGEPIPRNQLERLKQRTDIINKLYAQHKGKFNYIRAIDLHVDSRNKGKRIDVFFYHSTDKHSKMLATTMRDLFRVKYNTHQPGRGFGGFVEQRNLYLLKHLKPPSILVETGNIQNEFDRRRILSSDNRQALANWMAQAFYEDYKKTNK